MGRDGVRTTSPTTKAWAKTKTGRVGAAAAADAADERTAAATRDAFDYIARNSCPTLTETPSKQPRDQDHGPPRPECAGLEGAAAGRLEDPGSGAGEERRQSTDDYCQESLRDRV